MNFHKRIAAASLAALVATSGLLCTSVGPASASAGGAFDPSTQAIFASKSASQSDPTGLYSLAPTSGGTYAFTQVGSDSNLVYNALTFNPRDNYLYAISGNPLSSGVPADSLLKIGNTGGYSVVGSSQFADPDAASAQIYLGAIDPTTDTFYVMNGDPTTAGNPTSQLIRINVNPSSPGYGTSAGSPVTLSTGWDNVARGSDFTYSRGFLWALGDTSLSRINPATGAVSTYPVPSGAGSAAGDQAGAAWTFANGDLGFSYNVSGTVVRIVVTDPSAAAPTFTTKAASAGAASGQNDGAAIPGTTDLSVTKTASKTDGGAKARWTIVVKNNGGNPSSGWTVTDEMPTGYTDITASGGTGSQVSGNTVTVTGGPLAVGATTTITVDATADNPPRTAVNTVTVRGNEPDAVSSNNSDSAELTYPSSPSAPGANPVVPANPSVPAGGEGVELNGGTSWWLGGAGLAALLGAVVVGAARVRRTS